MARFGFCGQSYASQSLDANAQLTMNLYLEADESQQGKSSFILLPTPGTQAFATLSDAPLRSWGLHTINGRLFAVAGRTFFEVFANGTSVARGNNLANDGNPVSIASSAKQIMIASSGATYAFNLTTNVFAPIDPANFIGLVSMVGYADGFFVALIKNSQSYQVSKLLDCTVWDLLSQTTVSVFPDNIIAMLIDHREIWLFGNTKTIPYYDSGNSDFPFDVTPGGFIEQGIAAQFSPVRLDNSIYWIGGDDRGARIAWKADGYHPTRVSNYAIETAWQSYSTVADAVGYAYQDQGHSFWVLRFPTANKTWVYDVSNGTWHERGNWNGSTFDAHHSNSHVYAFDKHLVGDPTSGVIYQMAIPVSNGLGGWKFATDSADNSGNNGTAIRRVRRSPYVGTAGKWMFFQCIEFEIEMGLALESGQGSDPQIMLRWSNDGAKTWSNENWLSIGKIGDYLHRARKFGRLGRCWGTRGRVWELTFTETIPLRIIDADLTATDFQPQERLQKQIGKGA